MSNFIVEDLKRILKGDNPLSKLILINVIVFIVDNLFGRFIPFFEWLGLPGSAMEFIVKPWTLVTYMFMHGGFLHILFNMLWLYWMGRILLEYLGKRRVVSIYFFGGIAGGIAYLVAYNFMALTGDVAMGSGLIGASAGVMAVVIAVATLLPDYEVMLFLIGRVRMKYVGLGILILTSIIDFSINMGGKLAHLGGAALGYVFIRQLRSGNDWSSAFYGIVDWFMGLFASKQKLKVVKKPKRPGRTSTSKNQSVSATDQQRIDSILDKISESGYDALTTEEKEFLFRASNKK
ncbi:MAG: rhomboid family intramembrane serine protease [Crocinitomicaceae bacterium]|nr:rhomboid family intramembrane serine protease [Crocinitomicaceae bacterium]|tara:strand:- start:1247 stop:2119 length:873 start_codon:yes stop_codon:yes gene_type:complete